MLLLGAVLGGLTIAVVGYFVINLTLQWIYKKRDEYRKNQEIDNMVLADINEMMDKCPNKISYELLKKAREKGYTYVLGKISDGKMCEDVEILKDKNSTLDPEVEELLGSSKIALIS